MATEPITRTDTTTSWLRVGLLGLVSLLALALIVLPSGLVTLDSTTSVGKLDRDREPLSADGGDQRVRVIVSSASGTTDNVEQVVISHSGAVFDEFRTSEPDDD